MIVILVTFKNQEEARKIGRYLLEKKLIACVTIFPINSLYWWEGKIVEDNEIEAFIKTKKENFQKVKEEIERMHSYTTPQIITLPVEQVSEKYQKWMENELK